MKLNITLTEEQRAEVQTSADRLAKFLKKFASLDKQRAEIEGTKEKVKTRLVAALAAEEKGDEEASAKVYAMNRQTERLDNSLGRLDEEFTTLETEAAQAALWARQEIRGAHKPLSESIVTQLTDLIAPYCQHPRVALDTAKGFFIVAEISHFLRPNMSAAQYPTSRDVRTDIEAISATLTAMLAGEAVVTLAEEGNGKLAFPAYV